MDLNWQVQTQRILTLDASGQMTNKNYKILPQSGNNGRFLRKISTKNAIQHHATPGDET